MKKIGKALLFPSLPLLLLLLPLSAFALTYGMTRLAQTDPLRIGSYVLSFYTLVVWCLALPRLLRACREFLKSQPHVRRWREDPRLRMNVTLTGNVVWNGAYAALQLGLGWYHRSFWFGFLGGYHLCLALMRLTLVSYSRRHALGEDRDAEGKRCRLCGWALLLVNLALAMRILLTLREGRLVAHHPITTIAMATYTFTSLTMAIVNIFRYRKYQSPVLSASRAISLASALVSLLSLEGTMLVVFGGEAMGPMTIRLYLSLSGGGISLFIAGMAGHMIQNANSQSNGRKMPNGQQ